LIAPIFCAAPIRDKAKLSCFYGGGERDLRAVGWRKQKKGGEAIELCMWARGGGAFLQW